jgi:hypothetical protein
VIDEQYTYTVGPQFANDCRENFRLNTVEAGGRLVKQQKFRAYGYCPRELEHAKFSKSQRFRGRFRLALQAEAAQQHEAAFKEFSRLGAHASRPKRDGKQARPIVMVQSDKHILQYRQPRKRRCLLKRPYEAAPGQHRWLDAGHIAGAQVDPTGIRPQGTRYDVDHGRFAGTIGADQTVNAAGRNFETDI